MRAAAGGKPFRQRGIVDDSLHGVREGVDIIHRNEDPVHPVHDQFTPAIACRRNHRPGAGKAFGDHIAEGLMPRRAYQQVGAADDGLRVILPADEMDPFGNLQLAGKGGKRLALRPLAGQPQAALRQRRQRADQAVEGLVRMQPAKRRDDRPVIARSFAGRAAIVRAFGAVGNEIDLVVDPVSRHTFGDKIVGDVARVRHQPVAVAVIFEIVESAEAGDMRASTGSCHCGRPVHPAEDDIRPLAPDRVGNLAPVKRRQKRREPASLNRKTGRGKARHPVGIGLDHQPLSHPGLMKGAGKPLEEQLGTAMAGPGHGLEQPEIRHLACWRGGGHAGSA